MIADVPLAGVLISKSQYVSMTTSSQTKDSKKSDAPDKNVEKKEALKKVEEEPSEIDLYR